MPAPDDPTARADDPVVVEGTVLGGQGPVPADAAPRPPLRAVDAWSSPAPKRATRVATLIALSPLILLPFLLMATRLPVPLRPVLALVAVGLTVFAYVRSRKPGRQAYRVDRSGIRMLTPSDRPISLPFDSLDGLRIDLTGEGPGLTHLVFRPRGPIEASPRDAVRDSGGDVSVAVPQHDAARLDAAIRAAGAPGYRGIVRR